MARPRKSTGADVTDISKPGRLRRDDIRAIVSDKLAECGFDPGIYRWKDRPSELEILIGSNLRSIPFKSGMSKRNLRYELARLEAWADFVCRKKGLKPQQRYEPRHEQQMDLEEVLL